MSKCALPLIALLLMVLCQCWCGNAQDVPDVHGSATSCNMPCSGDNDQICGGRNALNAYRYTAESVPTTGYVGCYKDSKDNRIMVTKSNIIDMTVEVIGLLTLLIILFFIWRISFCPLFSGN